jgi:hypothetical protein
MFKLSEYFRAYKYQRFSRAKPKRLKAALNAIQIIREDVLKGKSVDPLEVDRHLRYILTEYTNQIYYLYLYNHEKPDNERTNALDTGFSQLNHDIEFFLENASLPAPLRSAWAAISEKTKEIENQSNSLFELSDIPKFAKKVRTIHQLGKQIKDILSSMPDNKPTRPGMPNNAHGNTGITKEVA